MAHPRAGQQALPEDLIDVDAVLGRVLRPHSRSDRTPTSRSCSVRRGIAARAWTPPSTTPTSLPHAGDRGVPRGPGHHRSAVHRQGHPRAVPAGLDHGDRGADRQRRHGLQRGRQRLHADARRCPARSWRTTPIRPTPATRPTASSSPRRTIPPRDGGFKYNPPHGGPADTDATSVIAARANELLGRRVTRSSRERFRDVEPAAEPVRLPHPLLRRPVQRAEPRGHPRGRACRSAPTRWAAQACSTGSTSPSTSTST